ncbi:MAG: DUF4974 domain-containing protein [Bacteroidales bacterium]|nr:DUF4974 domain-containing protein [Bacteroidales bacterium]
MENQSDNNNFLRFLKNEKFIEWQLWPTDELDLYWQNFLDNHPEERENVALAKKHFKNIKLSSYSLSDKEKEDLIRRIKVSVEIFDNKRKKRRRLQLLLIPAAAIFLILFGLNLIFHNQKELHNIKQEVIVGDLLNEQEIQLITEKESLVFENDATVEFDKSGKAKITQSNSEEKTVKLAETKLNTLIVPYGKRSVLTLSDGTKVWLNSGSLVEFPSRFSGSRREITLSSGEIYIEVAPDKKPFHVNTSDFNVVVYGTKFNISAYDNSPKSIVLVEGSIGLKASGGEEIKLNPSEQAIYSSSGTFDTQEVDVAKFISWKDGYLIFDNTSMEDVLKQIERHYNLSFNFVSGVSLKGLTCTGKIILSEELDDVMTTIALLTSTKYEKENNIIRITN